MASIRQITAGPKSGSWVQIIRSSGKNSRGILLDGTPGQDLFAEINLGPVLPIAGGCIISIPGTNSASVFDPAAFPIRARGPITPTAPTGDYSISSVNAAATPATQRPIMPASPFPASPVPPVAVPPAANSPVVNPRPPRTKDRTGISESELKGDGTPAIPVEKMGLILNAMPVERSIMFWGPPGCGKSQGVAAWCKAHGKVLFDVRLPLLDPIDLRGIGVPDLSRNQCRWLPAEFIPQVPNAVLFLDELSAAAPSVQAAAYQLTLDRKIGETTLPPDCRVIAAGNRDSDRGVVYRMPSPLANRFMHFTIETKIGDWRSWAFREGVDPRIISFLCFHGDMLHKMEDGSSGQAWPSPRSWHFASQALSSNLPEDYMGVAVAGCVGVKAARDFIKHCRDYMKYSRLIPAILSGGPATTAREADPIKAQVLAIALVGNCTDQESQINNAIRWSLSQNAEWTSLTVRALEERFGVSVLGDLPAYNEYMTPGTVPNPTGATRTPVSPKPPAGF